MGFLCVISVDQDVYIKITTFHIQVQCCGHPRRSGECASTRALLYFSNSLNCSNNIGSIMMDSSDRFIQVTS